MNQFELKIFLKGFFHIYGYFQKRKVVKKPPISLPNTTTTITAIKNLETPSDLVTNKTFSSDVTPILTIKDMPVTLNSSLQFATSINIGINNLENNPDKISRTVCTRRNNKNNNNNNIIIINNKNKNSPKSMFPKHHLHLLNTNKTTDNDARKYTGTGMFFTQNESDKRCKQTNTPTKNNKEDDNKVQHNTNILFELNRKLLSISGQPRF